MISFNIERPFLVKIYFHSNDYDICHDSNELPVFHVHPIESVSYSFGLYVSSENDIKKAQETLQKYENINHKNSANRHFLYVAGDVCRQTDVLKAASSSGYPLMVEKGAFLSPDDIHRMVEKLGDTEFALVECGSAFGYANRVLDPRSLYELKKLSPCFGVCLTDLIEPVDERYPHHSEWLANEKWHDALKLASESFKPSFYVYKTSNLERFSSLDRASQSIFQNKWDGKITDTIKMGREKLTIIAGPCMLESLELGLKVGAYLKMLCEKYNFQYIFKSSFDKANRTSATGIRGPGLEQGIEWLSTIKKTLDVPILTDVHSEEQVSMLENIVDVFQIPAFLCRNEELLLACAKTNKAVQIKKGQWLSANDMLNIAKFLEDNHFNKIILAERGSCFGYNNLVVDFKNLVDMGVNGHRVVFDATHATQLPGAKGGKSSGLRHMTPALVRAAIAVGVDGLFMEVHPNPEQALSDADTQISFEMAKNILSHISIIQ